MKLKQTVLLVLGLLPLGVIAQTNKPQSVATPLAQPSNVRIIPSTASAQMPDKGKLSYAIGMYYARSITNSIKRSDLTVDNDQITAAISDVLNGRTPRMNEKEIMAVFDQLKMAMAAKKVADDQESKAKGEAYLAQFAKAPGVTTLPGGLEYKVIKEGDGPKPTDTDTVTMAYRGTFVSGTEFDRGDNFTTSIKGGIIQGWRDVLPLMKVGSKWQVVIPAPLGYGHAGRPPKIPADSVLIFDMELKSIRSTATPPSPVSANPPGASSAVVSGQIIKVPSADELKKGAKIEVITNGQAGQ